MGWMGYDPHPVQDQFHRSRAKYRALIAGVRGGKSHAGMMESFIHAFHPSWRGSYGWVVAPTYPMLRDINIASALSVLQRLRPKPKFTWSKSDLILRIHDNGDSIIQFKSSEDPDMLRGVGLDWCWIDEASLMRAYVWDVLSTRLDKAWSRAWITTTPRGLDWVYEQFYLRSLQHQPDGKETKGSEFHPDFESWRFFTTQNTKAPQLVAIVEDARKRRSAEFFKQEYEASFERFTGLVYKDFDPRRHVREFEPDPAWDVWLAIDPGAKDPTAVVFASVDYEGRIWIWDEHYQPNMTIPQHADIIKQKLNGKVPFMVLIDPSAKQESLDFVNCDIPICESGLSKKRDIRAGILRFIEFIRLDKVVVHPRCENFLNEVNRYEWDDRIRKDVNQGDVPKDSFNHLMDAVRYIASMQPDPTVKKKDRKDLSYEERIAEMEHQSIEKAASETRGVRVSDDAYGHDGLEG